MSSTAKLSTSFYSKSCPGVYDAVKLVMKSAMPRRSAWAQARERLARLISEGLIKKQLRTFTMVPVETESKEQQEDACFINFLPRDLIERIFLRLPVSSLLSCTGVCKCWYNFWDPQFVAVHLQHVPCCTLVFFPPEFVESMHYPSYAIVFDEAWSQSTWKVLHRPRKRVGWESKKWEVWKNEFRKVEGLWSSIYQLEQNLLESLQCLEASHMKAKEILQHLPDEVFRQRVGMKINQILQNLPDFPHQGRAVICQYWIMTVMDNEFEGGHATAVIGDLWIQHRPLLHHANPTVERRVRGGVGERRQLTARESQGVAGQRGEKR
ncbi:hypothetical protein PR202_ga15515 [Eleusine coracana subsp. coracana]|uniref:F-box domain-containing protein n=1 Tax=Eleusine coracana subsp. coracana TaxID=191504 RepID=A0AAV5CK29_ELECO|nr:hypothetical protein PR202_ga15515 [Eleusine coracana subsp. coracana]